MRRVSIGGLALLLFVAITAPSKSAAGKPEPVMFVFDRVDHDQSVAYLRPMIAPEIGVQLALGAQKLQRGAVLRCEQSTRTQAAIVEGQVASVTELVLDCGDQKFVVKGLDFTQGGK